MHTQKLLAQLLSSPRSYSLPKSTTYTVVESQFLGLQLSRQILSVKKFRHIDMSECNKSWSDLQRYDRAIQP
jgi:hypothetical protein